MKRRTARKNQGETSDTATTGRGHDARLLPFSPSPPLPLEQR
jgi:hypothetical protein